MFISLLNLTTAMSQTRHAISIDVAGINPYGNPTDQEIRKTLGKPTQYKVWEDELGGVREYKFGSQENYDLFRYNAFGESFEFILKTSTYSLFTGRIKVGNPISKFSTLEGGLLQKRSENIYYFYPSGVVAEDYLEIKTDNNSMIKIIHFNPTQ